MKTDIRKSRIILGVIITAAFTLLILLALLLGNLARTRMRQDRPLVLIHSPVAEQGFAPDDVVTIHATARSSNAPLERIDLWIDGVQEAVHTADESDAPLLVLHESWIPPTDGQHTIVVTAQTRNGTEGQASLMIEVLPAEGERITETQVDPTIAEASNGDRAEDQPENHVAAGSGAPGVGGRDEEMEPPSDGPPAPGSTRDIFARIGFSSMERLPTSIEEPSVLRLEILELTTTRSFEGLHCYVGLSGGGLEATEAGYLTMSIPLELWDGIARTVTSEPLEGRFRLTYRVTPLYGQPPGHTIGLDLGMPPPTNLRIGFYTLHWRYPESEPIDGFRIFLNGELQWTEPADARQSYLPYEWLNPPCGETYEFYVDAYQGEDWSPPSNTVMVEGGAAGSEDCERTLIIEFQELETFDLSNDEDHGDWIGPVYGSFYVNDQEVRFNSSCHWGRYCDYMGFEDYSTYDIRRLTSHWGPGPARFTIDVGLEEDIVVGFDIQDQDSALWNEDDTVCADNRTIRADALGGASTTSVGGDFDQGCRATLTINPTLDSPATNPAGLPPRPQLAVTDLSVDEATGQLEIHIINGGYATWPGRDLDVIARWPSGSLIGQYTFPELVLRPGETTILKHPDLVPSPYPPLGACILLDPGNMVPEEEDYTPEIWRRGEYCRALPDLVITDVVLDQEQMRLFVTVQNQASGTLENRTLELALRLDEATTIVHSGGWSGVSMGPWDRSLLIWEDMPESVRQRLLDGYTVIIDPDNEIAETDGTNNSYGIPAGGQFRIGWNTVIVPYYEFYTPSGYQINEDRFEAGIFAETSSTARLIADWSIPHGDGYCEVSRHSSAGGYREGAMYCGGYQYNVDFELEGDETLVLYVGGQLHVGPYENGLGSCVYACDHELVGGALHIDPNEWSEAPVCDRYDTGAVLQFTVSGHLATHFIPGGNWITDFDFCRVE
jgi:hypothetical protein